MVLISGSKVTGVFNCFGFERVDEKNLPTQKPNNQELSLFPCLFNNKKLSVRYHDKFWKRSIAVE